jgi:hypothetical protein
VNISTTIDDIEGDTLDIRVTGGLLIMEATVGDATTTILLDMAGVQLLLATLRLAGTEMTA